MASTQKIYLGTHPVEKRYLGADPIIAYINDIVYDFRTDVYSASLELAIPGYGFTFGGYYDDYHADIKGTGTNRTMNPSGSQSYSHIYPSASVVDSGSYVFASEGYESSVALEGPQNIGVITTSDINIAASDFVLEGWINISGSFDTPPFHSFIFGSDASTDYLTIDYSNNCDGTLKDGFRVAIDGTIVPGIVNSGDGLNENQWYHFSVTKLAGNVRIHLNGNQIGSGAVSSTIGTPPSGIWSIGGLDGPNNNNGLAKKLQDFRFYLNSTKNYWTTNYTPPDSIVQKL